MVLNLVMSMQNVIGLDDKIEICLNFTDIQDENSAVNICHQNQHQSLASLQVDLILSACNLVIDSVSQKKICPNQ